VLLANRPIRPLFLALGVLAVAGVGVLAWFARGVGAWLVTAILAGGSAAIAGLVQTLTSSGLRKGGRLVLGAAPPVVVSTEFYQQELVLGGDSVRCAYVLLTVEAAADAAVILKRLRVVVVSRGPGVDMLAGPDHFPLPVRKFLVDLGEPNPRLEPQSGSTFPYVVGPPRPEAFQVMAYTTGEDVQWRFALDVTTDGKNSSLVIDQDGQPFRVSRSPAGLG